MHRVKAFLVVVATIAIGSVESAQSPSPDAARRQYDAYLSALRAAVLAGDADALGALVTEDRVSVSGATGKTLRGRAAQIETDRVVFRGSRVTEFEMHVTDFRSSGSMAYATGVGSHHVLDRATGREREDRFQYVDILVLEQDGRWRSRYFMNAPLDPGK